MILCMCVTRSPNYTCMHFRSFNPFVTGSGLQQRIWYHGKYAQLFIDVCNSTLTRQQQFSQNYTRLGLSSTLFKTKQTILFKTHTHTHVLKLDTESNELFPFPFKADSIVVSFNRWTEHWESAIDRSLYELDVLAFRLLTENVKYAPQCFFK